MLTKVTKTGQSFLDFKKEADVLTFPQRFSDYIRSYGDIYFWEKGNFHIITKAQHAKEILTSIDYSADRGSFFISRMQNLDLKLIQDFFSVVKLMMVMSDDRAHALRRKIAAIGFEDHILEAFSRKLKNTVKELVDRVKDQTHFDFSLEIAKKLPATVLSELFDIPQADREEFLKCSNIMTGFFGGASQYRDIDGIEVNNAALYLKSYFVELIKKRKIKLGDDYVSLMVKNQKHFELNDEEVISQLIMMLVAGMATTTDQINNIMFLLASNLEVQKEVRKYTKLIPQMLEECKRFDPAVTFIFRVARNDTNIGTQAIKSGDVIFISTHAINRDLPIEQKPEILDVHRKATNFAYGHGAHYCIGAKLARMEMNFLFEEIFKNIPLIGLDPSKESVRDHYSLSFSGFKNLFVKHL